MRLVESGVADHCVLVDTKVAFIFDCAARHPISLTEEALRLVRRGRRARSEDGGGAPACASEGAEDYARFEAG